MCGLAGVFSSHGFDREVLLRATTALQHRGPDHHAIWMESNQTAGLAHTRLSLLDMSANAHQPIVSTCGRLVMVHNGEFYDFERHRRELQERGHEFRSKSDSEILLPYYRELGTAALSRLRGEFAFILWDRDNQTVFAARDRMGIKPLFFSIYEGRLYLASEVKGLFAMGVPAAWDHESVYQYHQTGILSGSRTLYRDVHQVPHAHFLLASTAPGKVRSELHSYWALNYPKSEPTRPQLELAEEAQLLRSKLEESVRLRLRSDAPLAFYLSGGLDSCSVLGMASRQMTQAPHAFHLAFADDPANDESALAREQATASGAVLHEMRVTWQDLADHFSTALWHAEVPFVNANGVAKLLLSRAVRKAGFKSVMTGEGADEIFGGYVHFRRDMILQQGGADSSERLARLVAGNALSRPMMLASETLAALRTVENRLGFVPSFLNANAQGAASILGLLRADFQAPFCERNGWQAWLDRVDVPGQLWGRSRLHQSMYLWSQTMLPNYLLPVLGDRMEMAHSIEGRLPFLDHEVVEHAARLPSDLKINTHLTEKFLLREAMRPFVVDSVYRRQKQPFLAPPATASSESALFGLLQDTVRSQDFQSNTFYDQSKVIALLDLVPAMTREQQASVDCVLTNVLSFAMLQRVFGLS